MTLCRPRFVRDFVQFDPSIAVSPIYRVYANESRARERLIETWDENFHVRWAPTAYLQCLSCILLDDDDYSNNWVSVYNSVARRCLLCQRVLMKYFYCNKTTVYMYRKRWYWIKRACKEKKKYNNKRHRRKWYTYDMKIIISILSRVKENKNSRSLFD